MNNTPPPNSFFDMVTEKSDQNNSEPDSFEYSSETSLTDNIDHVKGESQNESDETSVNNIPEENKQISDSEMPHDARRALVHLMRQGSVISSQKTKLFELICLHELSIRRHLSEVYLRLVLDRKTGVAFVARVNSEHAENNPENNNIEEQDAEEATSLITRRTLSLMDTLILLVLRKHYQERESSGEQKITIDIERLESYLSPFLPITDHASKDRNKLIARVKEMVRRKVLSTIRGAEERYEITPIIRYVVNASFLESMLDEYTQLATKTSGEQQ